jgi:hypothetical protein
VGDIFSTNKAGIKKKIVEKMAVGISANELWKFSPYKYSDNLEKVSGGTGFEVMNGGLTLSGVIPIKKYPVDILGQAVINTSFNSAGGFDFFERGFDEASFRIGVNGELFFTNSLLTFLSSVDTVKLGRATLQAEFSDDEFSIRMAGEYSNVLEQFLGMEMMKYIPVSSREGVMYLRCTGDPDDFIIYMEEKVSLQIPGMGIVPLNSAIFKITSQSVQLSGSMGLPFGIGEVEITGDLHRNGTFLLKGLASSHVNIGAGMEYQADLNIEVSEKGIAFTGNMDLPYGIGNVEVGGGISLDEFHCSGTIQSAIPFPVGVSVNSNLELGISSNSGINLAGSIHLPAGIGAVEVSGNMDAQELLLTGSIRSGLSVNLSNVDLSTKTSMSLTASSNSGIIFTGSLGLPFGFGNASVSAKVVSSGVSMTGSLGSTVSISGYPLFNANMSMSASSTGGLYLSGKMKFPGNFGWVGVSGYVRNSGYTLSGNISDAQIDFGIVSLATRFSMSISNQYGVRTSANGEGCVDVLLDEVCADVDVDINIDYYDNSLELCIDFPVVGGACIGW